MDKFIAGLYSVSKWLVAALVAAMSVVIIAQIISRGIFHYSIFWAEELSRFCLIWITFIGASAAYKNVEMAALDLLEKKISGKFRWLNKVIIELLVLVFVVTALYYGVIQTFSPSIMNQVSPAIQLPMFIVYLAIPIGFGLMSLYSISSLIRLIKHR
ncbi:TRAP transporter small permease [Alteribacillus sp. YIM 98480]|uniref:TRAP transporter small permease n=1 Tax=Alteribacillus sp. YIM 98480 TaxID=2606599 RepID=UPI00131A81B5|nr:TRAP transporter small permease [Alteribacillus sp. YIM 98480]